MSDATNNTLTITAGCRVEAGESGTEDYDRGVVDRIEDGKAVVRWDSQVVTECPIENLRKI